MTWVATAIIGSAVVGGVVGGYSSHQAANAQSNAANQSTNAQLSMFNQTRDDQSPWRAAGATSLGSIMGGFGMPGGTDSSGNPIARSGNPGASPGGVDPGYFSHQFGASDLNANLAPNYDFMLKQGQGAVNNQSNMLGGLGGNSLAALDKFTTGYAQQGYQQAYTNYTANQTNIFNRLASISGLGQTAGSNQTTGGSMYGYSIGNSMMAGGNATAAGYMGMGNAVSGMAGGVGNYYMLNSIMNGGNNVAPGP